MGRLRHKLSLNISKELPCLENLGITWPAGPPFWQPVYIDISRMYECYGDSLRNFFFFFVFSLRFLSDSGCVTYLWARGKVLVW